MKPEDGRIILKGSHKAPLKGANSKGKLDLHERLEVTVRVRARRAWVGTPECGAICNLPLAPRRYLTREEFALRYGADPADFQRLEQFAGEFKLEVVDRHAGQRTMRLAGTVQAMQTAFGVTLETAEQGKLKFRHRSGPVQLPADIVPLIEGVF